MEVASKEQLRETVFQMLRFAIVGVIATAVHYGVYWLLRSFFPVTIAYSIGYVVAFVCNFILTCIFTFRKKASTKRGIGFGLAHLVNLGLHVALLNLFLWIGLSEELAPIPVFCIAIPVNFLLVRYVFKRD
ncbi:MAG: GtrA family protein [Paludibacteraceae bacterium]|jgi:putative flippase GtrA|nr:GtrA family protein [Paludibacteraceae bacterium]